MIYKFISLLKSHSFLHIFVQKIFYLLRSKESGTHKPFRLGSTKNINCVFRFTNVISDIVLESLLRLCSRPCLGAQQRQNGQVPVIQIPFCINEHQTQFDEQQIVSSRPFFRFHHVQLGACQKCLSNDKHRDLEIRSSMQKYGGQSVIR